MTKLPVQITDADLMEEYNKNNENGSNSNSVGSVSAEAMDPCSPDVGPHLNAVGVDGYQVREASLHIMTNIDLEPLYRMYAILLLTRPNQEIFSYSNSPLRSTLNSLTPPQLI